MAQTNLKVVRVVRRRNFYRAGTELFVDIFVRYNRDFAPNERENQRFANKVRVAFIVRMYRNGRIAQQRFRTCRRNRKILVRVLYKILNVPEVTRMFFILNLRVGQRRRTVGTPVDNTVTLIDEPLVVEADKHLQHRVGTALVHRKALPVPVARAAELLKLADNTVAVLLLPVPYALQKRFAPEVVARFALLVAQHFLNLDLCCDAGVVRTRNPQRFVARHPLVAD